MNYLRKAPFTRLWIVLLIAGLSITMTLTAAESSAETPKVVPKAALSQLKIGDRYAGGVIFYLDATGQHGLVASATDASLSSNWYDAKMLCNEFLNGYGDWFLPNKQQLNQLFLNKSAVGGIADAVALNYWSSTEASAVNGWYQNFLSGVQKADSKIKVGRVRPVRAF